MNVGKILDFVKGYYNLKKDIELAELLGVTTANLSMWRRRNSINIELLLTKCGLDLDIPAIIRESDGDITYNNKPPQTPSTSPVYPLIEASAGRIGEGTIKYGTKDEILRLNAKIEVLEELIIKMKLYKE